MARKAGAGVQFKITGVKEIQHAFKILPKKVANKVVRQSIRAALKPMLAAAKRDAPKGETGLLSRSVKLRNRIKKKRGVIALDVRVGDGDFKSETFYAAMVNYGTKTKDGSVRQEGQHYMEAAFGQTKDEATKTVRELITAGTLREWRNL